MSTDNLNNSKENNDSSQKKLKILKKIPEPELFPPLPQKPAAPDIKIQIEDTAIFPRVGILGSNEKSSYIGHTKPLTKLISVKTETFKHHLCSLSNDNKLKFWDMLDNKPKCIKNLEVNFEISDILMGNDNNLVICGEQIILYNLNIDDEKIENEENKENKGKKPKIKAITKKSIYKYKEFNLLARINNNIAVATSLNDYYLVFDLNTCEILKKIEMYKVHYLCKMERELKIIKAKREEKIKELKQKKKDDPTFEIDDKELMDDEELEDTTKYTGIENEEKKKKKKKIIMRDIGSGKCEETTNGHKGHVYSLLGLNSENYKNCIISGGEDNLIKIIKIEDNKINDLIGHTDTVISLLLDKNQQNLFSGSMDYTIRKWNLENLECEIVMEYINSIQTILLPMFDENYLLSIGFDAKVKVWNEDCLNVKTYIYSHGIIKTGEVINVDNEYGKIEYVFGDDKGDIIIKDFIVGEERVNKYMEYKNKILKEEKEKKKMTTGSKKNIPKVNNNRKDSNEKSLYNFKESSGFDETNTNNELIKNIK